jgi:hypothetical protein
VSEMKPFVAWILDAPLMRPIKDDPKKAALRARCQALVAEYDAPLPKGMRGWSKPSGGSVLFDRDSLLLKTRTTSPPRSRKRSSIRQSERCDAGLSTSSGSTSNRPRSLAGAAVKLRLLCDEDIGIAAGESEEDLVSLGQMREFVEPEVGEGAAMTGEIINTAFQLICKMEEDIEEAHDQRWNWRPGHRSAL